MFIVTECAFECSSEILFVDKGPENTEAFKFVNWYLNYRRRKYKESWTPSPTKKDKRYRQRHCVQDIINLWEWHVSNRSYGAWIELYEII